MTNPSLFSDVLFFGCWSDVGHFLYAEGGTRIPLRILVAGDFHVGSGLDYGRTPDDRLNDQRNAVDQIVNHAIDHDVDALVLTGDIWHRRRPTTAELMAVARPLRRLRTETVCDIVGIAGNHCVETADGPVALELFEDMLDVTRRPDTFAVRGGHIACLPWTPVSRLVAARDGGNRDDLFTEAADLLVAAARGLRGDIPAGSPAVLALHWSVSDAALPTGISSNELREVVLPLDDLIGLGYDAVVCSHLHRQQILSETPLVAYTGSPLPVDFAEANIDHGCLLVEIQDGETRAEFLPIHSRPFMTVTVDLTADRHLELGVDETDAVAAAIATHLPLDEAVVRIRYRATEEQARRIDWPKLRPLLEDSHKVYAVHGDIVRADRTRVEGMDEDLAPLAAVGAWCDANDIEARQPLEEISARYLTEVAA